MLSEEDVILLNELRVSKPEAYTRKLRILGLRDDEVPRKTITTAINRGHSKRCDFFTMGGKPYQGQRPSGFLPASELPCDVSGQGNEPPSQPKTSHCYGVLYLIDGDNHVDASLTGIASHVKRDDKVTVYATQDKLCDRLKSQTWYELIHVNPGKQAVDNRIKSELGNIMKRQKQFKEIQILSHDKGFDGIIKKYRKEFKLSDDELKRVEYY